MVETTRLPVKTEKPGQAVSKATGSWAPFDALRNEVDRIFENFGLGSWNLPSRRAGADIDRYWPREMGWSIAPAVDVAEKEKAYEITAELPGLDEKNIEVKVANGMLTIKGEKKDESEEREKDYYLSERRYGSFTRSFGLPDGVDPDKIEASFAKGVLTVTLPKTAEAQKSEKKITVKAA